MLNGLLFCECGRKYVNKIYSISKVRQNGSIWNYREETYRCPALKSLTKEKCNKKPFQAEVLENLIITDVKTFMSKFVSENKLSDYLPNWAQHFDAQSIMEKKSTIINIIDKIIVMEDNITVHYHVNLNDLIVANRSTLVRIVVHPLRLIQLAMHYSH